MIVTMAISRKRWWHVWGSKYVRSSKVNRERKRRDPQIFFWGFTIR